MGLQYGGGISTIARDRTVHGDRCGDLGSGLPYWCVDGGGIVKLDQPALALTNGGQRFTCALLADGGVKCWGGDPTMPPWPGLGSEVDFTQTDAGIVYGAWHEVDLGTHPPASRSVSSSGP